MAFIARLLEALVLGSVTFIVLLMSLVIIAFLINRGLQLFFSMFGYEIGDFFEWFMSKLPIKKKVKKEDENEQNIVR